MSINRTGTLKLDNPLIGLLALLFVPLAFAAKPPVFSDADGAIRGYDPVAYFTLGKPTRGSDQFSATWQGATYKFVSAEHLKLFESEPASYAPQFGGYCAYAVSKGATATTIADAWTIVDGKLYLNYSLGIQQRWRNDVSGNIKAANSNWPDVLN